MVMAVPSRGALADRWRTALSVAAPGMFCTMMLGLPGM